VWEKIYFLSIIFLLPSSMRCFWFFLNPKSFLFIVFSRYLYKWVLHIFELLFFYFCWLSSQLLVSLSSSMMFFRLVLDGVCFVRNDRSILTHYRFKLTMIYKFKGMSNTSVRVRGFIWRLSLRSIYFQPHKYYVHMRQNRSSLTI
jgi:hypothetical protein